MVIIRLARTGSKKNPFYHLVVTDKRNPRDGRYIEKLGYFNPMARGQAIRLQLDKDRIEHWLGQGAKLSERADHLVKQFNKQITAGEQAIEAKPTRAEARQAQSEASASAAKKKIAAEAKAKAEEDKAAAEEKTESENAES